MTPRISKFSQTQNFTWSNGDLFNGAAIIALVIPTQDGTSATVWPDANYGDTDILLTLPKSFARVPINDGKLNDTLGLFYNADITPPNTQYVHYITDSNNKVVAGPGALFTASSGFITLPTLTINAPISTGAVIPVPG